MNAAYCLLSILSWSQPLLVLVLSRSWHSLVSVQLVLTTSLVDTALAGQIKQLRSCLKVSAHLDGAGLPVSTCNTRRYIVELGQFPPIRRALTGFEKVLVVKCWWSSWWSSLRSLFLYVCFSYSELWILIYIQHFHPFQVSVIPFLFDDWIQFKWQHDVPVSSSNRAAP